MKATQEEVDKIHPLALEDWAKLLEKSGKTELMFKVSRDGMGFMAMYQMMKETAEGEGFTMPELFEGTKITFMD